MATQLRDPQPDIPVQPVPAIGYSIVANIGPARQFTAQCFVGQDESDAEVNAKVDRVMRIIDRQRAIYEMEEQEAALEKERLQLFAYERDISSGENRYEAAIRDIDDREKELVEQRGAIMDAAQNRGRSAPVGAESSRYNAMGQELGELKKRRAKEEEERKNARLMMAPNVDKQREIVARIEQQIEKAKALIAGE